jgi:hypothetical protein
VAEIIEKLGFSMERLNLIDGLLRYREKIHDLGLTEGFQWINGSFAERVEELRGRPPGDIDVVSFVCLPVGMAQKDLAVHFNHASDKNDFYVDSYFVELGKPCDVRRIRNICYWFAMWSHNRGYKWKGFLSIPLSESREAGAWLLLDARRGELSNA